MNQTTDTKKFDIPTQDPTMQISVEVHEGFHGWEFTITQPSGFQEDNTEDMIHTSDKNEVRALRDFLNTLPLD